MPNWGGAAGGALTGATIGSFVPGVGTAIGAGVGGLIGLFKHKNNDPDKPDKEQQMSDVMDLLKQNSARTQEEAGNLRSMSAGALGPSMEYLQALAGNDPTAREEATKADRGKVMDQYDAARKSIATFGPRGGASNLALAESYTDQAAKTSDILSTSRQGAAQMLASMGIQLSQLGLTAESLSNASLDDIMRAITGQQQLDLTKRGQNMEMWGGIGKTAGNLLGVYLGRNSGGSGGLGSGSWGDP